MPPRGNEIPTIDVSMVVIKTASEEMVLETASKVSVEPIIETTEAQKLIVKGKLLSQKKEQVTILGNKITLTDNVLNPQLLKIMQGGTIVMDEINTSEVKSYTPPVQGSSDKGEVFEAQFFSAVYTPAGTISKYEKITYPNCTGTPFSPSSEDGVFRASELTINSAPNAGEAPYKLEYVSKLPVIS